MKNLVLSDEWYNRLKWIAQYLLPGLGTLYFGLSSIWGLPLGEQIVGTITVIDAFLGGLLGISSLNYNKQIVTREQAENLLKSIKMEEDSQNKPTP